MTDEIVIIRPAHMGEGTWDNTRGRLVPPNSTLLYDGVGFVTRVGRRPLGAMDAGRRTVINNYKVFIPLSGPKLQEHDKVTVSASLRNPQLVGATFNVKSIHTSSFSVSEIAEMEVWEGNPEL